MKLSIEKALQVCGNNNKYQKLLFMAVALTWFSVDFVSISFPLLELMPNFECKNDKDAWGNCTEDDICKLSNNDFRVNINFATIISDFELYCKKTLVILIGVIYTIGIVLGAFLASKLSDVLGRKPVLLLCHFIFVVGAISMTFVPHIYFVLGILFFIGIACAGGTMVSFLYIYEVLSLSKRSIYGTLINSSFALAGIIYFSVFRYLKNWKYLAYMCCGTDIIAGLLVLVYFTESPRFYFAQGQMEKALKALYVIAKKNGKTKDFYKYLVSDLSIKKDYIEKNENSLPSNDIYSSGPNKKDSKSQQNLNIKYSNSNLSSNSTCDESPTTNKNNVDDVVKDLKISYKSDEIEQKDEPFLTNSEFSNIKDNYDDSKNENKTTDASFFSLIKYKSLRWNFLICCYLWFALAFTYYGISMGLKKSGDEIFIDGYVVYGAEAISYLITGIIISLPFFGRIRTLSIMFFITCTSTLGYFFFKKYEFEPYDKILLFLARFGITSIFSLMYTYSTEIYPTRIRAKGLGINTLFARFASILVPIVVELFNPFLIYSGLCLLGFLISFYLPETFGKELEDEIFEEKLSNRKIFFENN